MALEIGTRTKQSLRFEQAPSRKWDRGFTRDVGISKRFVGSVSIAGGVVTGIAGNFTAFLVNDPIRILGPSANNGEYTIIAKAGDGSTITLNNPTPVAEGPLTVEIRTT